MEIKKIDRDDVEEIFVLLNVLLNATYCDNAIAIEMTKRLLEKFKITVGFSKKDKSKVESIEKEYKRRIAVLKEKKEKSGNSALPVSLEERMKIFWDIMMGN